jgi:hypothetical protein
MDGSSNKQQRGQNEFYSDFGLDNGHRIVCSNSSRGDL